MGNVGNVDDVKQASRPAGQKPDRKRELFDWIESIVISVLGVVLVFTFILRTAEVDGDSMLPTLHDADKLIISNLFYEPKRLDIVVLNSIGRGEPIVKRVIGLPGDRIDIDPKSGTVYVNDQPLTEPYIAEAIASDKLGCHDYPVEVPQDCIFVLGDNRNASGDSREYDIGFIDKNYIIGRVLLRFYPFSDFVDFYF